MVFEDSDRLSVETRIHRDYYRSVKRYGNFFVASMIAAVGSLLYRIPQIILNEVPKTSPVVQLYVDAGENKRALEGVLSRTQVDSSDASLAGVRESIIANRDYFAELENRLAVSEEVMVYEDSVAADKQIEKELKMQVVVPTLGFIFLGSGVNEFGVRRAKKKRDKRLKAFEGELV